MKGLSGTTASMQAGVHGTMQAQGWPWAQDLRWREQRPLLEAPLPPRLLSKERSSPRVPQVQRGESPAIFPAAVVNFSRLVKAAKAVQTFQPRRR